MTGCYIHSIYLGCAGVGVLANREVMQALNTLHHFNQMTNGSLFGAAPGFGDTEVGLIQYLPILPDPEMLDALIRNVTSVDPHPVTFILLV